ncbi:MAG: hypothetical protein RL338_1773 [Chloroflexota bacterium]
MVETPSTVRADGRAARTRAADVHVVVPLDPSGPAATLSLRGRPVAELSLRALAGAGSVCAVTVAVTGEASPGDPGAGGLRDVDDLLRGPLADLERAGVAVAVHRGSRWEAARVALATGTHRRIAIHAADRPLVGPATLDAVLAGAAGYEVAVAVLPATYTYKRVADGLVTASPPRDRLRILQGPWVFERDALARAMAAVPARSLASLDELGLVRAAGLRVRLVAGDPLHVPVATPAAVRFAELALGGAALGAR